MSIEVFGLNKTYKNGPTAVDNVTLSINSGEIFTIMGPNGAGKTTLIRIIATQLMPSDGHVRVCGYDVVHETAEVRRNIAVVPQEVMTYGQLTPHEYAYFFSRLHGNDARNAAKLADQALDYTLLQEQRDTPCIKLSLGQQRRAVIASALSSNASVLILDEPTTGLDPIARQSVWTALRELTAQGKTILLTTHSMDEAELLSDRVAILHEGTLLSQGTVRDVKSTIPYQYRLILDEEPEGLLGDVPTFRLGSKTILYFGTSLEATQFLQDLLEAGHSAEVTPTTLEDVYVRSIEGQS